MKINWKHCIVGLLLLSITILYFKESQENKKYEMYLSQEISNKHNVLIASIFSLKDEITSLLNNHTDSITNEIIVERLYIISRLSQDLDYYVGNFRLAKGIKLQNKTSSVSNNFAGYFEHIDISMISNDEKAKLSELSELLDKWIIEISQEYIGITRENQKDITKYNTIPFVKSDKWIRIIVELDKVSRKYEGISRSGNIR